MSSAIVFLGNNLNDKKAWDMHFHHYHLKKKVFSHILAILASKKWVHFFQYLKFPPKTWQCCIVCMCAKSLQLCPTLCNSELVACQAPRSIGFSWQEDWSGLPCPLPGGLPDPVIQPMSLALQAYSLLLNYQRSPML